MALSININELQLRIRGYSTLNTMGTPHFAGSNSSHLLQATTITSQNY